MTLLNKGKELDNHIKRLCDEFKERKERYENGYPRVKLIRIQNLTKSKIMVGFEISGLFVGEPKVGKSFWVGNIWKSTPVKKIIDDHTFKTRDSVYKYTIINKDDDKKEKR